MEKAELLARLAEGHAARITVVTPNTRLSQAVVSDFDFFQTNQNKTVWEAADILPFSAFVERLYEDALYSDLEEPLPLLLTPAQEHALWAEAVRASSRVLLSVDETAADCARAWQTMHEWRIGEVSGNEDVQAFREWAAAYRRRSAGEIDAARLPDLLVPLLPKLKRPKLLVAYAFDLVKPQARDFFDALASQGVEVAECKPAARSGSITRVSFSSGKEELEKAAAWARSRLEDRGQLPNSGSSVAVPDLRIGVVVPDLEL